MRPKSSIERRVSFRRPFRLFTIFTEGKNTEPEYFLALRKLFPSTLIRINIERAVGAPMTIAEHASDHHSKQRMKKKKGVLSSFEEEDQTWAVYDRDAHPFIAEAAEKCRAAGVQLAFSDPCFELWLILHLEGFDRPDDRHSVQRHLRKICSSYDDKSRKTAKFEELLANLDLAEERAQSQFQRRQEEGGCSPPYTTVFQLTRALRGKTSEDSGEIKEASDTPPIKVRHGKKK